MRRARSTRGALLLLLLALLLPACGGLPLPSGVRDAGPEQAEQADPGGIVVVAPGPQPGMTATELVRGYLFALSVSPQDDHAIARSYLAPGASCCDGGSAVLYPTSPGISVDPADEAKVIVTFDTVGRILEDGSYRPEAAKEEDDFAVTRVGPELRLAEVPDGLRLLQGDLERTFTPYDVHFLGRAADGGASPRLVPDRVFLPATADRARALVDALLRGPSARLSPAVLSAVPPGTTAEVDVEAGVVTVDLSGQVAGLDARARQRLSAQLTWTLVPAFTGVRLLVDGEPLDEDADRQVQDRDDWREYDPSGVEASAPLLFVRQRRLLRLDDAGARALDAVGPPVDEAALSPTTGQLGVRTRVARGVDEIRTGPLRGAAGPVLLARTGLSSLSWGSGDRGLWVLQPGRPSTVWLLPNAEAGGGGPRTVAYDVPRNAGPLTRLQVSRDGARVALVFGSRLYVGLVVPTGGQPRIEGVEPVARDLAGVTDVAWQSGTSLVALGSFGPGEQPFLSQVAVDGSSSEVVERQVSAAEAVEVAAAPRQPLVVAARVDGRPELFRDNREYFAQLQEPGGAPFYPG